ncbi:hypothetical protein [Phenylobacterium sp.]|uniref:hypothetical protein n=1 Tax=Phenylobacterium sp. TaxID=1871053 RepID=UPI002721F3DF|nr:hypothetical protein [Phenylobacterium sp.]MDO8381114.1 hypothetical protein [Phenylobacterium sp.]
MSRRTVMSSAARPPETANVPGESAEDRRDREILERARQDLRAGRLDVTSLEEAKRELGD